MLVLLSPSKTLNFTDKPMSDEFTTPRMLKKSTALIKTLQNKKREIDSENHSFHSTL